MATAKKSSTKGGGVRFSEEPDASAPTHVHFDDKLHDSVVMVTPEADGNFMVKRDLSKNSDAKVNPNVLNSTVTFDL